MPRYRGKYTHTVDEKGRAFIPSKFRDGLGDNFVICKGISERCLYILPDEVCEAIDNDLASKSFFDENVARVQREFYSNSADVSLDKQGRVLIPQDLRDFAGIDKEAIIIGAGSRIEMWDAEALKASENPNAMKDALRNIKVQGNSI